MRRWRAAQSQPVQKRKARVLDGKSPRLRPPISRSLQSIGIVDRSLPTSDSHCIKVFTMGSNYYDQVSEAANLLRERLAGLNPRIGIVLGSGLGAVADSVVDAIVVPYGEIPHFPQSTVEGHSGRIVAGLLGETPMVIMQGRVHFYEGYSPGQVTFPMRV